MVLRYSHCGPRLSQTITCVTSEVLLGRHPTDEQGIEQSVCYKNWQRDHCSLPHCEICAISLLLIFGINRFLKAFVDGWWMRAWTANAICTSESKENGRHLEDDILIIFSKSIYCACHDYNPDAYLSILFLSFDFIENYIKPRNTELFSAIVLRTPLNAVAVSVFVRYFLPDQNSGVLTSGRQGAFSDTRSHLFNSLV